MYLCLSDHASIMFQVCGGGVRGSPEKGQEDRVKQPACVGSSLHMALGILSFTPNIWFTIVMLTHMHGLFFLIQVSDMAFALCAKLVHIVLCML